MSGELSANEVSKLVQELKSLERRFGGEDGLINHLYQLNEDFISQSLDIQKTKKDLENLFQKLQDSKNLKLEVENLKFNFVGKKEFDDLTKLVNYIVQFKSFIIQKSDEINNAYIKLNRLWLEENEILQRIEKLEKNLISKVLLGGVGIGTLLTLTTVGIFKYFIQ